MLKETETEETRLFCHIYIIGAHPLLAMPSGGFRGGDGGDAFPPPAWKLQFWPKNQPLFWIIRLHFGMHPPPTDLNVTNPAEKSVSILVKTFFFFFFFFLFFWRPPDFGRKKRLNFRFRPKNQSQFWWRPFFFFLFWRPPDFGRKKRLNFQFRPKNQSQFWWRHPNFWGFGFKSPPPKFSGSATGYAYGFFNRYNDFVKNGTFEFRYLHCTRIIEYCVIVGSLKSDQIIIASVVANVVGYLQPVQQDYGLW